MTWNCVMGIWHGLRGYLRERWGALTNDDLDRILGRREVLIGRIQERYNISAEEAEMRLNEWASGIRVGIRQVP